MKNKLKSDKKTNGIKAFNTIYLFGIAFVFIKVLEYLVWTFQLLENNGLPEEPFFSKVNLDSSDIELSVSTQLIFASAYILGWGFVIFGLFHLNKTTKSIRNNTIFQEETKISFQKAGKSFLAFAYGTLIIDIALLAWAHTSNRVIDLLSTELMIFLIFGYLMFFLADIFQEGVTISKENELTI